MGKYDYFKEKKISFLGRLTHAKVQCRILHILKNEIVPNSVILEIGPGVGGLAKLLGSSGYRYFCFDRSRSLVEYLCSIGIDARCGEVPPLPIENESVDCVILVNVFEHMADSTAALQLLNEIRRVLRVDGKVFMIAPNLNGWGNDFYDVDYTHSFPVSPERIRQIFSDSDLDITQINITYGGIKGLCGLVIDKMNSAVFSLLYKIFPTNPKVIKAKILFHPVLWVVGKK